MKWVKNYIKKKEIPQKNELHNKCKIYRNLISTLMKRSKQSYSFIYDRQLSNSTKNC